MDENRSPLLLHAWLDDPLRVLCGADPRSVFAFAQADNLLQGVDIACRDCLRVIESMREMRRGATA